MDDKLRRITALGFAFAGQWEPAEKGVVCELGNFATICNALYAFAVDGKLMYVGKTVAKSPLRARLAGYRNPATSQSTNIKNNRNIRNCLEQGNSVEVYVLADGGLLSYGGFHLNLAAGLEDSLVRELDPQWNGGQKDSSDETPMPLIVCASTPTPTSSFTDLNDPTASRSATGMNSFKYEPLRDYLGAKRNLNCVRMTFKEIEALVGEPLPCSAYTYREWWANQTDISNRPQARAWKEVGFAVGAVDQTDGQQCVDFIRR